MRASLRKAHSGRIVFSWKADGGDVRDRQLTCRPAGDSSLPGNALRSDTHVKSAYQLQLLKTLPHSPNSLPDCDLRREALPVKGIDSG
jgi:hypothetical protein